MSARWVSGNALVNQGLPVATGQAVERHDMIALQANTIVRASDMTWGAAVATPAAPTVANNAVAVGSSLTNNPTSVKISYQFQWGEGVLSAAGTATPAAGAALKVSGVPLKPPPSALWTNVYVETSAGSGVYGLYQVNYTGADMMVTGYGLGNAPASIPLTVGALQETQFNFAQLFVGGSNQRKVAGKARIFGNSLDNMIMCYRNGVVEYDTASFSYNPGDYVGPDKDVGNTLLNQQVALVSGPELAIGRVILGTTNAVKVMVEIMSRYKADLVAPAQP